MASSRGRIVPHSMARSSATPAGCRSGFARASDTGSHEEVQESPPNAFEPLVERRPPRDAQPARQGGRGGASGASLRAGWGHFEDTHVPHPGVGTRASDRKEDPMAGTREDALLVVELAKYAAMLGIADATGQIFGDEFDPDRAELGDPAVRIVLGFNGLHAAELAEPVET